MEKSNLLKDNKELIKEYNYEKNRYVAIDNITLGSSKNMWWMCEKGHEWEAAPYTRKKGHGCPYCSELRVITGTNDLKTLYPELIKEWDFKKI